MPPKVKKFRALNRKKSVDKAINKVNQSKINIMIARKIDKAIEDKLDSSPVSSLQTFAAYSSDTTPTPDLVSAGYESIGAVPNIVMGTTTTGGTTGEYIGNEIRLKKMHFDVTMYPMTNATKYGRTIKIYLIGLKAPNAQAIFNVLDVFENDFALDSLNSVNYPGVQYLTPRCNRNDNFKKVYKILKTWTFKIPNNINATDGANWVIGKRLEYDWKGKVVRLDASGNYLDYYAKMIFTTDVGNDGPNAVTPAFQGSIATTGNTGVNLLYQRKNYYEDA